MHLTPSSSKRQKIRAHDPDISSPLDQDAESSFDSTPLTSPPQAFPPHSELDAYEGYISNLMAPDASKPSRSVAQKLATAGAWRALLPQLVYPLMAQLSRGKDAEPQEAAPCSCAKREARVLVVSFTGKHLIQKLI